MAGIYRRQVRRQYRDASRLDARVRLHERFGRSPESWQRWVFDRFALPVGSTILEVGCGPADLWCSNSDRLPDGWSMVLTDLSVGMLRDARDRLSSLGNGGLAIAAADARALPFQDEQFDAVVANHMLYYVGDIDAALAEVARVLRPRGRLFASTVGLSHMYELFAAARSVSPGAAATPAPRVAGFSIESGEKVLSSCFDEVCLEVFDNPLEVDDSAALLEYLASTEAGLAMTDSELKRYVGVIDDVIDREGTFHITTATGIFTAAAKPGAGRGP